MEKKVLPQLPINISDWRSLRESKCHFVDKTALIPDLVTGQRLAFLARPRRFGKSTLVSMLAELFAHGDSSFEGLAVYGKWPERQRYPVVQFNFMRFKYYSAQAAEQCLCYEVVSSFSSALRDWGLTVPDELFKLTDFTQVTACIEQILGAQEVVVLVDEWDYPLIAHFLEPKDCSIAEAALTKFYQWLGQLRNVHFALVTGITSCHSAAILPAFTNLSLEPHYATLVGFTAAEVEANFAEYIEEGARRDEVDLEDVRAEIKAYYQGFCFEPTGQVRLYNPWDIVNYFKNLADECSEEALELGRHWINCTGADDALYLLLEGEPFDLTAIMQAFADELVLTQAELTALMHDAPWTLKTLLHQTGMFSIKGSTAQGDYLLGLTDIELFQCWRDVLVEFLHDYNYSSLDDYRCPAASLKRALPEDLVHGELGSFCLKLNALLKLTDLTYVQPGGVYPALLAFWLTTEAWRINSHLIPEHNALELSFRDLDRRWEHRYRLIIHEVKSFKPELLDAPDFSAVPLPDDDCIHLHLMIARDCHQVVALKILQQDYYPITRLVEPQHEF